MKDINDVEKELDKIFQECLGISISDNLDNLEYEEKKSFLTQLENQYIQKFNENITQDAEYDIMLIDEKIKTIQECLEKNKSKEITYIGYITPEEFKKSKILSKLEIYY